jgi:uncharacterized protein (DUF983 family)
MRHHSVEELLLPLSFATITAALFVARACLNRQTAFWRLEPTFWAFIRVVFVGFIVLGYGMFFYREIGELWAIHYIAVPLAIASFLGFLSYEGVRTWQVSALHEDTRARLQPLKFWASVVVLWLSLSFYVFFAAYAISRVGNR